MPKINTDFIPGVSEKDKDQEDPTGEKAILLRQVKAYKEKPRKGKTSKYIGVSKNRKTNKYVIGLSHTQHTSQATSSQHKKTTFGSFDTGDEAGAWLDYWCDLVKDEDWAKRWLSPNFLASHSDYETRMSVSKRNEEIKKTNVTDEKVSTWFNDFYSDYVPLGDYVSTEPDTGFVCDEQQRKKKKSSK
jgi:hypothetical protein